MFPGGSGTLGPVSSFEATLGWETDSACQPCRSGSTQPHPSRRVPAPQLRPLSWVEAGKGLGDEFRPTVAVQALSQRAAPLPQPTRSPPPPSAPGPQREVTRHVAARGGWIGLVPMFINTDRGSFTRLGVFTLKPGLRRYYGTC